MTTSDLIPNDSTRLVSLWRGDFASNYVKHPSQQTCEQTTKTVNFCCSIILGNDTGDTSG